MITSCALRGRMLRAVGWMVCGFLSLGFLLPAAGFFGYSTAAKYNSILISNTGTDATSWWYYYNVIPSTISSNWRANGAQLISIAPNSSGRFTVIMVKRVSSKWWWYYGKTLNAILNLATQNGARVVHLEPYYVSGVKYYAAIMVNNT